MTRSWWASSPVAPGGALSDTVLFPWRTGTGEHGLVADEPAATTTKAAVRPVGVERGLLLARVALGGAAVLGGARTLFGLPLGSGAGPASTEALLAGHGFAPAAALTTALGWVQLVAGVLVVVGVLASFAAAALLAVAVVAVGVTAPVAWAAGAVAPAEAPLFGLALAAVVVLAGPGRVSGDAGRAWARAQTAVGLTCLLIGVATGLTVLLALR